MKITVRTRHLRWYRKRGRDFKRIAQPIEVTEAEADDIAADPQLEIVSVDEGPRSPEGGDSGNDDDGLDEMKVDELRAIAAELELDAGGLRKAELVEAIREARAAE